MLSSIEWSCRKFLCERLRLGSYPAGHLCNRVPDIASYGLDTEKKKDYRHIVQLLPER